MTSAHAPDELLAHASFVRSLARRLVADENTAEDLVQETWRAALERPPRRDGDLRPWLATLVRNFARKDWRSSDRRRRREAEAARNEAQPSVSELFEREATLRGVVDAVLALDQSYREIVILRYYEALTPSAIADRLSVPLETVRTRLARAIERLRRALDAQHGEDRRAWCLTLGTLSGAGSEAVLAPTSGAASMGVLLMNSRVLVALIAALVLTSGLFLWRYQVREPSGGSQPVAAAGLAGPPAVGGEVQPALAEPAADTKRAPEPPQAAVDVRHTVSGRVVDSEGQPVTDVKVAVVAEENPFVDAEPQLGWNQYLGRTFPTDERGRFEAELPGPRRVMVGVLGAAHYTVEGEPRERWVDTPAEGIEFVVLRSDTARLDVRAIDLGTRKALTNFTVVVRGSGYHQRRAEGEVASYELMVPDEQGLDLHVSLAAPDFGQPIEQEVRLAAGEHREVHLGVPAREATIGQVVDASGAAIADALVFFGSEAVGRGDEPGKPFKPERVHGARTDSDGWFQLTGHGQLLTAWHADYSPATVALSSAARIVLGERGMIRGLVLGEDGKPLAQQKLKLDRERETTTDAGGRFQFDAVEAGARMLRLSDDRRFILRIAAGEVLDVTLGHGLESVELVLEEDGRPLDRSLEGLLIGLDTVTSAYMIDHQRPTPQERSEVEQKLNGMRLTTAETPHPVLHGVLPGNYLLVTTEGLTTRLRIDSPRVVVALGKAALTLRAKQHTAAQIVPAGSDAFTRLVAARMSPRVGEQGVLRLGPIEPGRYEIVGEAGHVIGAVEVEGPDTELDLR